jgi:hypothetical protein
MGFYLSLLEKTMYTMYLVHVAHPHHPETSLSLPSSFTSSLQKKKTNKQGFPSFTSLQKPTR